MSTDWDDGREAPLKGRTVHSVVLGPLPRLSESALANMGSVLPSPAPHPAPRLAHTVGRRLLTDSRRERWERSLLLFCICEETEEPKQLTPSHS